MKNITNSSLDQDFHSSIRSNVGAFGEIARRYWDAGLPVIPLLGKRPVITQWQEFADRMPTVEERHAWLDEHAGCNVGLALGKQSGVSIIDIDTTDAALMQVITDVLPPSPWVRVGRKGMALAYRWSGVETFRIKDVAGGVIVECLSGRTQVVLPPSMHPDTHRRYTANVDLVGVLPELRDLGSDVERCLREALQNAGVELASGNSVKLLGRTVRGSRDTTLTANAGFYARQVRDGKCTLQEALDDICYWVESHVEQVSGDRISTEKAITKVLEFLVKDEAEGRSLSDGWDRDLDEDIRRALPEGFGSRKTYEWNEFGLVDRLVDFWGDLRFKWVPSVGWMQFDDDIGCWVEDAGHALQTQESAREVIELAELDAEMISNATARKSAMRFIRSAKRRKMIQEILEGAKSRPGIFMDESKFDANPLLLNTPNGTVNLKNGEFREHNAADFVRKCTGVGYAAGASCPMFVSFLKLIFKGDCELIDYMQRVYGYAATGFGDEKFFVILQGESGDNGKSTFQDILRSVFGEYAVHAKPETFRRQERSGAGHSEDIVRLNGARLVTVSEPDRGFRLDGALIKALTGGDKLTARRPHAIRSVTFAPSFLVSFDTNPMLRIDACDKALMSRVRQVEFTAQIPKGDQIPGFARKVITEEGPGVLNWLIEGCLKWQDKGLWVPSAVKTATEAYGKLNDNIAQFLEERTINAPGMYTSSSELYLEYRVFMGINGRGTPLASNWFGRELANHGIEKWDKNDSKGWRDIKIRKQ